MQSPPFMSELDQLTRQVHGAPRRRVVVAVLVAGLCVAATSVVATLAICRIEVAPAVHVITVVKPVVLPVPLVMPPAVVAPEPAPAPRAASPRVDPACVIRRSDGVEDPACRWDHGFPAISADGALIAAYHVPDDGGRGNPGLTIRFVDTATSRRVRDVVVLSPDEFDDGAGEQPAALHARMARRAAAVQRILDAGGYRSLRLLADGDGFDSEGGNGDDPTLVGSLRTEIDGDAVRVIDVTTSTTLVQARFPVTAAFPDRPESPDFDGCYPSLTREMDVWWDEAGAILYAEVTYSTPPCYCSDELRNYVRRARP